MAPTSDKRLQAPHIKEGMGATSSYLLSQSYHHGHNSAHTKENATASNGAKTKRKELEILDFHESWLEEMEMYKDKLYVQKKHLTQQLLGSHNHVHTPQGCQLDSNGISRMISKNLNAIMNASAASSFDTTTTSGNAKRRERGEHNREQATNSNVTVRGTMATAVKVISAAPLESKQNTNAATTVQLLLKRPRVEASATAKPLARISKRLNHNHSHNSPEHGQNSAKSGNASPHSGSTSPSKITVTQFHASSWLSSLQHDERTKILTQNGIDKTAATASIYASHYLAQDKAINGASGGPLNGVRCSNVENGHSKGCSPTKDANSDEDDPCAAIDAVNDTDSDSDEEYTGFPFYLAEDGNDTYQSRHIRYQSDLPSTGSEESHSEYYQPKTILTPSLFPKVPPYLNFSSHAEKGPAMPPALHKVLKWKLSPVMPRIVKRVVLNSGFRIIKNTTDWMAIWERHMKSPGFRTIRSHQKYNHMPGSFRIGRKDSMWRSIYDNVKKFGSKEFGFMQKSYIMPDDLESLRKVWPKNASKLAKWIVKPPASARGTGIRIVNKWSQFPKDRPLVVQKYIERPLLINDNKFDMRIYVIVTSINPLRIYMYKDGLARFASVKYSSELNTLDDRCMHLTNYSINKFSENYSKNEDFNACQGHKWTLQSLWSCLESRGVNTKRLWATLRNLVIRAIISGESGLNRMYRQNVNFRYNCFELFGFDVLLDENLIPWLLEINISPSLHSELPLDLHVKGPLIQAVLNTALYQVPPKLNEKQQNEILNELNLEGPLCHDKRIFTTCLTAEEVRKHNHFTNRTIEFREEYIDAILDNLLPDDVRCLIVAEDEYARSKPLERIFPTSDTYTYLKFVENPRYYNRLLDAWEHKYGHCRDQGIALLRKYCEDGYHLQVSEATLEKEPNVTLTEIDMLHTRRNDDIAVTSAVAIDSVTADDIASKASSPVSVVEEVCTKETNNSSSLKSKHVLDPQF